MELPGVSCISEGWGYFETLLAYTISFFLVAALLSIPSLWLLAQGAARSPRGKTVLDRELRHSPRSPLSPPRAQPSPPRAQSLRRPALCARRCLFSVLLAGWLARAPATAPTSGEASERQRQRQRKTQTHKTHRHIDREREREREREQRAGELGRRGVSRTACGRVGACGSANAAACGAGFYFSLLVWIFLVYILLATESSRSVPHPPPRADRRNLLSLPRVLRLVLLTRNGVGRGLNCVEVEGELWLLAQLDVRCPYTDVRSGGFGLLLFAVLCFPVGIPLFIFLALWYEGVPQMAREKRESALFSLMATAYITAASDTVSHRVSAHIESIQDINSSTWQEAVDQIFERYCVSTPDGSRMMLGGLFAYLEEEDAQFESAESSQFSECEQIWHTHDSEGRGSLERAEFEVSASGRSAQECEGRVGV
eukprot:2043959-Rhodomonas_salina.1